MTSFDENGVEWGFHSLGSTTFQVGKTVYEVNIIKELWEIAYNIENRDLRTFIISDTYYENLVKDKKLTGAKYLLKVTENSDNRKIYAIGYTTQQLISEVRKEMATLFFIPVSIGTSLSLLYVIFSNESANLHLVLVALQFQFCFS